jgi:hypothetical protein
MGRIVNRRNALFGWAMWRIWRNRARRRAGKVLGADAPRGGRLRRVGKYLGAALAALGLVAMWRKIRANDEDEWMTPEPLDLSGQAEDVAPLSSVPPDDDIPPAA